MSDRLLSLHGNDRAVLELERNPEGEIADAPRAREVVNLRVLLEMRRRLKAAAERELATGADRLRGLRHELHRGEAELRLFGASLKGRAEHLVRALARVQTTQARAAQTCARLESLEREHDDLCGQLGAAEQGALDLRKSVRSETRARNGTLDTLVLATDGLAGDLAWSVRDEAALRARGRDLTQEGDALAARAEALLTCFASLGQSVAALCDEIEAALDGLPACRRRISRPAEPPSAPSGIKE